MKVTLDLDELLQSGDITKAEYDRLSRFAAASTGSLAFSIFVGFGIIAVGVAALALAPAPVTAVAIGLCALIAGIALQRSKLDQWQLLATICMLIGALMAGGGLVVGDAGSLSSLLIVTVIYAVIAAFARSRLMAVLATLALAACIGAGTGYFHAGYSLEIQKPIYTIVLFSIVAVGLHRLSGILPAGYARICDAAARTAVILINFGFWVGSLWGDNLGSGYGYEATLAAGHISAPVFAALWALALLAAGVWAWRSNRRWVLNTVAIFAAINLYTQWFEHLQTSPGGVLAAGLLALAAAVGLRFVNVAMRQRANDDTPPN